MCVSIAESTNAQSKMNFLVPLAAQLADRLREAEVPTLDRATCRAFWDVGPGHLCAGVQGGRGACFVSHLMI